MMQKKIKGNNQWLKKSTILLLLIFPLITTYAQQVTATVDRNKILIGEPITLTLKVTDVEKIKPIIKWFALPDSTNHIEVIERNKIDTFEINGLLHYQQIVTVTSFDSGSWSIPALEVMFGNASSAAVKKQTDAITITVLSVDVSLLVDYHDIKDIIEPITDDNTLIFWVIGAIVGIAIIVVLYLLRKKYKKRINDFSNNSSIDIYASTMQQLATLQQAAWYNQQQEKKHYQILITICKQYLQQQVNYPIHTLTTDEWMLHLQQLPIDKTVLTSFMQLLRLSDAVKFAQYIPDEIDNTASIDKAKNMIHTVAQKQEYHA